MMQLNIQSALHERFQKLKEENNRDSSDNDFLQILVTHYESCRPGVSNYPFKNAAKVNEHSTLCPECKFVASSTGDLLDHFETLHPEDGCFPCTCGISFDRLNEFLRHYIDCSVAATDLQDPVNDTSKLGKGFSCSCGASAADSKDTFDDADNLDEAETEHYHSYRHPSVSPVAGPSDDKPYGCPKCFKGFKSKSLLDQHMHLHYPPRYKCRWCGNIYRWPPVYYHHKQKCKKRPNGIGLEHRIACKSRKTESSPLKFEESVALAQNTLVQFMGLHSLPFSQANVITSNLPVPELDISNSSPASLTCLCTEVFPTMPSYFEHITSCPKILSASGLENVSNLSCSSLGLDLSTQDLNHCSGEQKSKYLSPSDGPPVQSNGVNGIFSCSTCYKEFNSKLSLKQHVDGKHRAEGKYVCPTCGKRYRWGASFYYHKKTCMASARAQVSDHSTPELLTTLT